MGDLKGDLGEFDSGSEDWIRRWSYIVDKFSFFPLLGLGLKNACNLLIFGLLPSFYGVDLVVLGWREDL